MNLSYRDATEADLPAIIALLADDELGAAREDATTPLSITYVGAFKAISATPYQRLLVASNNDIVIGTMQLLLIPAVSRKGSWRGQIEAVRIASHLRGGGLGETFVQWAIEQCRAAGCVSVQLTSDSTRCAAHRFWRKNGFKPTHIGFKIHL